MSNFFSNLHRHSKADCFPSTSIVSLLNFWPCTGYREGQGLGKDAKGTLEPLKPEVCELFYLRFFGFTPYDYD